MATAVGVVIDRKINVTDFRKRCDLEKNKNLENRKSAFQELFLNSVSHWGGRDLKWTKYEAAENGKYSSEVQEF